jgi:hypothetical protein
MLTLNTTCNSTWTLTSTICLSILVSELLNELLDLALLLGRKTINSGRCFFWFRAWLWRWGRRAWDDVELLEAF